MASVAYYRQAVDMVDCQRGQFDRLQSTIGYTWITRSLAAKDIVGPVFEFALVQLLLVFFNAVCFYVAGVAVIRAAFQPFDIAFPLFSGH